MKMGQKDGKREGEATSTRRLSPFHLLLFRILPTLPQLTALSPNALAISQILRRCGETGGISEAEGKVMSLAG
jgi:hypothetical protein